MNLSFEDFYEHVWRRPPYPWQIELARRVSAEGWPDVLDVPTGAGKTTVMDIALHHFVMDGGNYAPRRMILVVDRRVIVDQVAAHARTIQTQLEENPELQHVQQRLRQLVGKNAPLLVTSALRGGRPRDDSWAAYPHVPVLATSTVDQVGSRLLFRGYGCSRRMQPVHAGLLGCDTLLFLDEVHLSRPFAELLAQLSALRTRESSGYAMRALTAVQLSATPGRAVSFARPRTPANDSTNGTGASAPRVFRLSDADRRNERLARTLRAQKPSILETVKVQARASNELKRAAVAEQAARRARELMLEGRNAVAVVLNRVDTARRTWALLQGDEFETVLLTGRMRPLDQAESIQAIEDRVMAGRTRGTSARPLVVVATQCIEAGADYDFDGMVTELASLDALRQRFGRLDRRGELTAAAAPGKPLAARGVILARTDLLGKDPDPVYGATLQPTWHWLTTIARDGIVDFGIDALQPHLDEAGNALLELMPDGPDSPVLVPAYLDQWIQTNPRPAADPDVSLFLHGIPKDARSAVADVQVVWRADITEELLSGARDDGVHEHLATTPPASAEAISLPIWVVKQWLSAAAEDADDDIADIEGVGHEEASDITGARRVFIWRGRNPHRTAPASVIEPGAMIVIPTSYGGIGPHRTFDPAALAASEEPGRIQDLGDVVQLYQRGSASLRLDARVLDPLVGSDFAAALPDPNDFDTDTTAAVRHALDVVRSTAHEESPDWFNDLLKALGNAPSVTRTALGVWIVLARPKRRKDRSGWSSAEDAQVEGDTPLDATDDGDEESFTGERRPDGLMGHLKGVMDLTEEFAVLAGLPDPIRTALRWAGCLHDVGKADPRFQVLLYGGDEIAARFGELLAKSDIPWQDSARRRAASAAAGYPPGQRHELVSLDMIERSESLRARVEGDGADWDLVLHLVTTHHGWGRAVAPFMDSDAHGDSVTLEWQGEGLEGLTAHGRDRFDSGVADRFWRVTARYGRHELAYYEAILRLADHRHSAESARS